MTKELPTPITNNRLPRLRHWARTRVLALVLIALVALAYYSAMGSGFIWNDIQHVTHSAPMRSVDGLKQTWLEIGSTSQYSPLVHTSFWLEYKLWGTEFPNGYHVTNIIFIHALAVVLLWRILSMLNVPGAWFAAAIFAVHPVHVESVAWISERENVLSGLFYLWSLWAYLAWVLPSEKPRSRWLYGFSLGLFVCALLCKTVACTLPLTVLMILWWKQGHISRRDLLRLLPFFALGLTMWLKTVLLQEHAMGAMGSAWDLSPLGRALVPGRVAWFYAWKLAWPQPLVFIYPLWQIDASQAWQYVYPVGIAVLLLALWLGRARIGRGAFAAVVIFLFTLSPAMGLFNSYPMLSSFVSDHFQYLASIALIALFVSWASTLAAGNRAADVIRMAAGIGLLVVLTLLTNERCRAFRDSESLWLDTLAKNPQAWMAHNHLGMVRLKQGDLDSAKRSFETALELRPESVRAHNNMGGLLEARGQTADAMEHFEEALRIEPDFVGARLNLCKTLAASGEIQEAMPHYLHALRVNSRVARTHDHLAFFLLRSANREDASEFFDDAISVEEDWGLLLNEMAWMLATSHDPQRRDPQRALTLAHRAVEATNHANPNILDTLAAAQAATGDFDKACETQRQAIAIVEQLRNAQLYNVFRAHLRLFEEKKPYVEPKKRGSDEKPDGP